MLSLFPSEPVLPHGFTYVNDFLSLQEEMDVCREISNLDLHNLIFQGFEAKRKIASFGYDWSFDHRVLSKGKDIPLPFLSLIEKTTSYFSMAPESVAELLVTEYPVNAVINWHRDAPPFEIIIGLSLLSDCNFRFRPYDKAKQHRKNITQLPVRRRSLYIMQGEARSEWEHSISPVKELRYSLTLRTLKV